LRSAYDEDAVTASPQAPPGPDTPALPARVQAYVGLWIVAGIGTVLVALLRSGERMIDDPALFIGLLAGVAVAELTELRFHFSDRFTGVFTLIEAAVIAVILLLSIPQALLAVAGGVLAANILRRRELTKIGFNTAQIVVSAGAAAVVLALFPDVGPQIAGHAIYGAVLGMVAYGIVNFLALAGLLSLLADRGIVETLRDQGWLMLATLVGDAPLGLLAAELVLNRPSLLPLLIGPTAAVYFAYRGTVRTNSLLAQTRADHERLERVTGGTSDGIMLLDRDGRIEVYNDAMFDITGVVQSDAMGRPVTAVLGPFRRSDGPTAEHLLATATPNEPAATFDATLRRPDGTTRVVRESHTLLFDERGRCTGDVVLYADVTREREVEAMKDDFVARVSHELRTPLTPIKGFADMLMRRGEQMTDDQRHTAYERIVERANTMAGLVEDLLLVTQIDDDPGKLVHPVRCFVDDILESVVAKLDNAHPGRQVVMNIPPNVGAAMADPDRTRQILAALLDNALRYSEPDTLVEVDMVDAGDDIAVQVRDYGPGIPSDQHDAVFDRFHRLEDVLRMTTGGVGLGLFLAKRLAEAMHGRITLESKPDDGAIFTLYLPAAVPMSSGDTAPASYRPGIHRLDQF